MAAKAAMAQGAPNYFTAEAMGFILAALFFNTLTAPVVKMTQNSEGGYDYNKWCIYFFAELMKLGVALAWCFKAYQENDREVVNTVEIKILRRVRAESSRPPPRHRRDACSMAWRCRFITARPSQDGRVIARK